MLGHVSVDNKKNLFWRSVFLYRKSIFLRQKKFCIGGLRFLWEEVISPKTKNIYLVLEVHVSGYNKKSFVLEGRFFMGGLCSLMTP